MSKGYNDNLNGRVGKFLQNTKRKKKGLFSSETKLTIPEGEDLEVLLEMVRRLKICISKEKPGLPSEYMGEILVLCEEELSKRKIDTRTIKLNQLGI